MAKSLCCLFLAVALIMTLPSISLAQAAPVDLANATLEELMTMYVTSAARKSQRAEDVASAIYVITGRDIRQSGLTTLPEILRLAPGVQVAQVTASKWAVSIRGFNSPYSNKLLVLIDGRSVYSRTFSGVFWDLNEVMVADIDRIEVIRGPGGVAWGANAVNGVISIITRPATEQQGLDVQMGAGTFARASAGIRHGGTVGSTAYRVFSQFFDHADSWRGAQPRFLDNWRSSLTGARLDWARGRDAFMAQGHFAENRTRAGFLILPSLQPGIAPVTDGVSHINEASAMGRWTRSWTSGGILQVQGYHTTMRRDEPIIRFTESSSDIDVQHETRIAPRHDLVFGGWGLLPSARAMWAASPGQRVWAAASRARRTPSTAIATCSSILVCSPSPDCRSCWPHWGIRFPPGRTGTGRGRASASHWIGRHRDDGLHRSV